jgi:hypothetical protein
MFKLIIENCSNHYYHLEEKSIDEIDFGKVSELMISVRKYYSNKSTNFFPISSESDTCKKRTLFFLLNE